MFRMKLICLILAAFVLSAGAIFNGNDAERAQFPFFVSLRILKRHDQNICGGALISNQWILTSASCLKNVLAIMVHLGDDAMSTTNVTENGRNIISIQSSSIGDHIYMHPKYSKPFK